jgi:glycerol-3-phosphate acyltransferase PlsY
MMLALFALFLVAAIPAYLIGSFPTGYVIGKLSGVGDIRNVGSGNIGATNMVRAGGKKLGALVLLIDAIKAGLGFFWSGGILIRIWARAGEIQPDRVMIISLCVLGMLMVFIGHMFPVWLKFKGGKGVSIMIGSLIGLPFLVPVGFWPLGVYIGVWAGCYLLSKTSSLSGLTATASVVAYFFIFAALNDAHAMLHNAMGIFYFFAALLVFYRHKDNIRRLLRGEELAFSKKNKTSPLRGEVSAQSRVGVDAAGVYTSGETTPTPALPPQGEGSNNGKEPL